MARVEKNSSLEKQITDVKGDVVREVRRRTHKSRPWLMVSLFFVVLFLVLFLWISWSVARTGLVQIPVLTGIAYEAPEPMRVVLPGVPVETVLQEMFTSTLTRRLYEGGGELLDKTIEVRISEESLTASVRTIMEESGMSWLDGSNVQIVIEPDADIEIFIPIAGSELHTALTALFSVSSKDGSIVVTPVHVEVGSANIPDIVVASFLKPFLEAELARVNTVMVGYAEISSIEILSGEMVVSGELAVEIQGQ